MLTASIILAATLSCATCTFFEGNNCATDMQVCNTMQCCVGSALIGQCKRLQQQGDTCETFPQRDSINSNLYQHLCPCAPGLQCEAQDSIGIQLLGSCQVIPQPPNNNPVGQTVGTVTNNTGTAVNNTAGTATNTVTNATQGVNNTVAGTVGGLTNTG